MPTPKRRMIRIGSTTTSAMKYAGMTKTQPQRGSMTKLPNDMTTKWNRPKRSITCHARQRGKRGRAAIDGMVWASICIS